MTLIQMVMEFLTLRITVLSLLVLPKTMAVLGLGFMINEVLYDPPSGDAGDANGDGTRDPHEDEFIEFYNSGLEIDLSGYTISDASQLRHTFPTGSIIPANGVLVLFGGGNPSGDFGNSVVQTASEEA